MSFTVKELQSFIAYIAVGAVYTSGIEKDKAQRNLAAHKGYLELVEKYDLGNGIFKNILELIPKPHLKGDLLLNKRKGAVKLTPENVWQKGSDVRALIPIFMAEFGKKIKFKQTSTLKSTDGDIDNNNEEEIPEIFEELPSGTTMEELLKELLQLIYTEQIKKRGKTVDIEPTAVGGGSTASSEKHDRIVVVVPPPAAFFTVEFLIFKYFVCLADNLEIEKDAFMVTYLLSERPGLEMEGGRALVVPSKSRTQLKKEQRLSSANNNVTLVDLTTNANADEKHMQDCRFDSATELKAIEIRQKMLPLLKEIWTEAAYQAECVAVYNLVLERQAKDKANGEGFQRRAVERAESASKVKLPAAKKIKTEKRTIASKVRMSDLLNGSPQSNMSLSSSLSPPLDESTISSSFSSTPLL